MENLIVLIAVLIPISFFYFAFVKYFKIRKNIINRLIWSILACGWGGYFYFLLLSNPPRPQQAYHPFMLAIGVFCVSGFLYQNLPIIKDRLQGKY
jgi:hypothetical protein